MEDQMLKRKLDDAQIHDDAHLSDTPAKKQKKKKKPKSAKQRPGEEFDDKNGLNLAISRMPPQQLVDYVESRTKQFEPNVSTMELEDQRLPVERISDTTSWTGLRTLDGFASFLEQHASNLTKAAQEPGSPHTLVIAGAGLRAADITRALRKFQNKDAIIAKLFAKHIKLKESIELCKKKRINIGVGTPQRIIELLEDGCLSTKSLERVIIDASHIDQKRRGLLEMKDTLAPTIKLLNLPAIQQRPSSDNVTQIVFY